MASRFNLRSISLPSRSHPSTIKIEEELNKLKTWEASSTTTSESICIGLSGLLNLYNSMDDLLNMPSTQEVLFRHRQEKCLEELLDGSVVLLDICSIARDKLSQFKEQVQDLESALRRRKGDSSEENYISLRKKMKKEAKRLIAGLKQMDNKTVASQLLYQNDHICAVIRVLREVNTFSSTIFQSLLMFLSTPVSKTKQSKWSLVSKLIHKGVIASEENMNELESVDEIILSEGTSNTEKMQLAHEKLEALEKSIEKLENFSECVFRRLIKSRFFLLNIISH